MDFIAVLLAYRSGASCDHCDRTDDWLDDMRFRSLRERDAVSCPGCSKCDGRTGLTTLCEDCHRKLVRER